MSYGPYTRDYITRVKASGGVYIPALPRQFQPDFFVGAPGARFKDPSAPHGYRYDLAGVEVRDEQGWTGATSLKSQVLSTVASAFAIADGAYDAGLEAGTEAARSINKVRDNIDEQTAHLPSMLDILAAVTGLPQALIVLVLLVVGYGALRQYKIVPPLSKVWK